MNPKICFCCGADDSPSNPIDRHDIVPKRVRALVKTKYRLYEENLIHVCSHCHKGIHHGGRLLPGTKSWKRISRRCNSVRSKQDFQNLIRQTLQETIIDRQDLIKSYKEFLEYKDWHSAH